AITLPTIPFYVQETFGGSVSNVSSLAAVFFAAQFFASPILGSLSDRYGRRPILILSQFGTVAALLLSGLAPTLAFLYAARVIDGITGGNIAVAEAYLSDITDKSERTQGLGIVSAGYNGALLIGPIIGGILAVRVGFRIPFFIAAGISACTIVLTYFLLPKVNHKGGQPRKTPPATPKQDNMSTQVSKWGRLLGIPFVSLIIIIAVSERMAYFIFQPTFPLWIEQVMLKGADTSTIQTSVGWLLAYMSLFNILTQIWLIGPASRLLREKRLIILGTLMSGLGWYLLTTIPTLTFTIILLPVISMGIAFALPSLTALVTFVAPEQQRGYAIGFLQANKNIGRIAGAILGGIVFDYVSPQAPMQTSAVLALCCCAMGIYLLFKTKHLGVTYD
ncbi:MAG: MFS transporter, partial [Candidatus Promineifilaceae bacterium]